MKLLHIGLHNRINQNAGDTVLFEATRKCFEHYSPEPITWGYHQLWEPFNTAIANTYDGVVVGGGGLLLPDQVGAEQSVSGWQWNCALDELERLKVPLIIFGVGHNRFRNQPDFRPEFYEHFSRVLKKASFVGLRERYAIEWARHMTFPHMDNIAYQPCPTTILKTIGMSARTTVIPKRIGFSYAGDRTDYRFNSNTHLRDFVDTMCAIQAGTKRAIDYVSLHHKYCDTILDQWSTNDIPLWNDSVSEILDTYGQLQGVIGMRGHSSLIACGLGIPFFSIASHDKITAFLEDIDEKTWGGDVLDLDEMNFQLRDFLSMYKASAHRLANRQKHVATVQKGLALITQRNMRYIGRILKGD